MIEIDNQIPRDDALLGLVRAEGVEVEQVPSGLEPRLAALLARRRVPLNEAEEAVRRAARDLLRNGSYKPTGRGKPASEYLVRAAHEADRTFPRINGPVDVCNYLSLKTLLPISLWDLDRAGTERFVFRLGRPGEGFVFNAGGQVVDVTDLVVGCRVTDDGAEEPIVNPVKDSLATKTTAATRRVAACLYTPQTAVFADALEAHCAEFAELLARCGEGVDTAYAVLPPGGHASV